MRTYEYKIERAPYPAVGDYTPKPCGDTLRMLTPEMVSEYQKWLTAMTEDGWEFVSILHGPDWIFRRPAPPFKGIIFCDHVLSREERKEIEHAWDWLHGAPAQEKD